MSCDLPESEGHLPVLRTRTSESGFVADFTAFIVGLLGLVVGCSFVVGYSYKMVKKPQLLLEHARVAAQYIQQGQALGVTSG